jgi:hypothetical protein
MSERNSSTNPVVRHEGEGQTSGTKGLLGGLMGGGGEGEGNDKRKKLMMMAMMGRGTGTCGEYHRSLRHRDKA